ncbi:hypothetical protein AB6A40_005960 [Gnathostoma spinigerum]|uniref:Uncharacterized protein n=1 Tax=Gnathostoma spinigerum TaxID=75299 RepID=A0ABD6EHP3_9BILA
MGLTSLSTHQPAVSTISTGPQCGIELSAPLNSTSKPTNNDLQDKVIINDFPSVPPAFYSLGSLERTTAASPVSRTYAEPSSSFCRTQSPSLSEKRSIIQQLDGSPTSLLRNSSSPQYDESMSNGDARKNIQRIVVQMNGFEENDGDPSTSSLNGINIPPGAKGSGLEKPVESSSQSSSYSSTSYSQHSSLPQASSYLLQPSRLTQRNYLTTGSSDTAAQVKILTPPDSPDIVKPQVDSASSASIQAVVESSPCISESLDTTPVLTASVSISPKPPRHASEIPVLKCDHYDSVRNITKTEFSTDHLQPQLSVNVSTTKIRPPSASSLQHPAKSQSQKPSSSHIPVSTLPEKSGDQQPISPVSDSSRSRSRLPVPSTSSDAAKCATHERVSHSRIPKMTSGHRPPHFNPHTQVERCQAGITTSIPTFRNGFPPTHSQVTTDI